MRVALHATSEVGRRAGHILLAEHDLTTLGLVDASPSGANPNVVRADDLAQFDVFVGDDRDDPAAAAHRAATAGIHCVLWDDGVPPWTGPGALLTGANLASGMAPVLLAHEAAAHQSPRAESTVAWTEPGKRLRRGVPVAFPDPVGSLWAKRRRREGHTRYLAAPVDGEWAGAMVMVGPAEDPEAIVGVADLAVHLESIALAAGVICMGRERFGPGRWRPVEAAEDMLATMLDLGLEVAGFVRDH